MCGGAEVERGGEGVDYVCGEARVSADANVWQEKTGNWCGVHDGDLCDGAIHHGTAYDLTEVLTSIEKCMGGALDWEIRQYANGFGLDGRQARSGR